MNDKIKILLDTDIGTDIDDAVALAYLLKHEACHLSGITTVSGEPDKRAMIADAICKIAGQQIPIHSGCPHPMRNIPQRQKFASHAAKLCNFAHQKEFPPETAVDFMRQTILDNPGEINLLSIGPLTNIGKLFLESPEIPAMLKTHFLMGGAFYDKSNESEWNILCDPHAAQAVFMNPAPNTKIFGLNVTQQVVMDSEIVRKKFHSEILQPVLDFAEIFFEEQKNYITFHDPLAATAIFRSDLCSMQRGDISIVTEPGKRFGATLWTPSESGRTEIAITVNENGFFDDFFSKTLQ